MEVNPEVKFSSDADKRAIPSLLSFMKYEFGKSK
jgi:hypothetical protein